MKNLFLTLIFCLTAWTASSQFEVSIESGVNVSRSIFTNLGNGNYKYHPTIFLSLTPRFRTGENISYFSRIQYLSKGFVGKEPGIKTINKLSYFTVVPGVSIELSKIVGVDLGFDISFKRQIETKTNEEDWIIYEGEFDGFSNFDFGPMLGLHLNYSKFHLYGSYVLGLVDVIDYTFTDSEGKPTLNTSLRNRYFQFGIGLYFRDLYKPKVKD